MERIIYHAQSDGMGFSFRFGSNVTENAASRDVSNCPVVKFLTGISGNGISIFGTFLFFGKRYLSTCPSGNFSVTFCTRIGLLQSINFTWSQDVKVVPGSNE